MFRGPAVLVGADGELCLDLRPYPPLRSVNDPRVTPAEASAFVRVRLAGVTFPKDREAASNARDLLVLNVAGTLLTCIAQKRRGTVLDAECSIDGVPMRRRLQDIGATP